MFPISDSIKARKFPILNILIVLVTIFVFVQQLVFPESFTDQFSLIPAHVNFADYATLIPFVTAIFLHGGFLHIISNMWFLIVFGDNVEDAMPPLSFLSLYFLAGIAGNLLQFMLAPTSDIPMLGASGAIAGILGCYYVLYPYAKVKTLIFIFFFVTIVDVSAAIMLGYWFILQIFSGVASIPSMYTASGGIAFFAHIAGFVVGLVFGNIYKRFQPEVLPRIE